MPDPLAILDAIPPEAWLAILGALGVFVGCSMAWTKWQRAAPERALLHRAARAAQAEEDAAQVLREWGYVILDDQAEHTWVVHIDGAPRRIDLRADYLVRRGRRRYVAEVKTGRAAPDIACAATRRQLLEYRLAYAVDGVLLVDMEAMELHEVVFDIPEGASQRSRPLLASMLWLLIAAGVGAFARAIWF
ncbi:MAG: hypothetical protein AAGI01_13605 [Myxococcota bacterium]